MQAVEFETDVKNNIIEIPPEYKKLFSKHVKVIVLLDEEKQSRYDFSDLAGKLEWDGDSVSEQRKLRDEW